MADKIIKKAITVTDLNRKIKNIIQAGVGKVCVVGEISNWKLAASGHCYFALKDEKSIIRAVMFAGDFKRVNFKPKEGDKIEIEGECTVYEARGEYQIIVSKMEQTGLGDLYKKFIELKEKLQKEGLFNSDRKKPLPFLPGRIGIVTSPTGAAIKDVLNILNRRFANIEVILYPVKVQGEGAGKEIARAINRLNELKLADVLIVGRGGGSMEDLWAFNEEVVARAIFDSQIPVISAVGHEIDFTIADFVADLRAPTPSAAAELVVKNRAELLSTITSYDSRLSYLLKNRIELLKRKLESLNRSYGLRRPVDLLRQYQQSLDDMNTRLDRGMKSKFEKADFNIKRLAAHLEALNPEAVLGRGYSIVFKTKKVKIPVKPEIKISVAQKLGEMAKGLRQNLSDKTSADIAREEAARNREPVYIDKTIVIRSPADVKPGEQLKIKTAGGTFEALAANEMPLFDFAEE